MCRDRRLPLSAISELEADKPVSVPPPSRFLRALNGEGYEDETPRSFPR